MHMASGSGLPEVVAVTPSVTRRGARPASVVGQRPTDQRPPNRPPPLRAFQHRCFLMQSPPPAVRRRPRPRERLGRPRPPRRRRAGAALRTRRPRGHSLRRAAATVRPRPPGGPARLALRRRSAAGNLERSDSAGAVAGFRGRHVGGIGEEGRPEAEGKRIGSHILGKQCSRNV